MDNNALKVFNNSEFGDVRVQREGDKVLFSGTDVARALGYSNPRDALRRHCKGVVKRDGVSLTTNQHGAETQQTSSMSFLYEGDVYRLIAHSKLPSAVKFERWVFDEVLPSIRKHGAYLTDEATDKLFQDPDTFARLAVAWRDEARLRREAEAKIEADKPKVLLADSITESKTDILIGELAKILKQNGVKTGQNRLFERLRQDGYLVSREGLDYNMPTQKSMELGLMRVKEGTFTGHSNNVYVTKTVRITGKGQLYFVNKYAGKAAQ